MKTSVLQAITFGILLALMMALLKCHKLANEHSEFFGKRRPFVAVCPSRDRHIIDVIVGLVFWFMTGFVFYQIFWAKYIPLW